jgi:hypothetical protein
MNKSGIENITHAILIFVAATFLPYQVVNADAHHEVKVYKGRSSETRTFTVNAYDGTYDQLKIDYPIMVQDDLDELFRAGQKIKATIYLGGGWNKTQKKSYSFREEKVARFRSNNWIPQLDTGYVMTTGMIVCTQMARICKFEKSTGGNLSFIMSPLDDEFYFSIDASSGTSDESDALTIEKARLVKATNGYGYLYVIDYSAAKPSIIVKLFGTAEY